MTKQEFHQKLYDSMSDRFSSLNENWQGFSDSLRQIQQGGTVSNELAVTYLAHSVEMLGLRIQYLQSALLAVTGGGAVAKPDKAETSHNTHVFVKSRPANRPEKLG
jgi:hypothetical protein